ncbi:Rrf2 family transcriptional regulator [Patescibacteria group bacterium]|nr:Rrf2 family transcriptional regulator [Patescibacteria group bacterium]
MMQFSTKAEYSLKAMINLAKHYGKEPISLAKIAKEEKISKEYLEQLIAKLKANNLVKSTKGVKGGYILTKKPNLISAADVIEATEGSLAPFYCVSDADARCCTKKDCLTKNMWINVKKSIKKSLESTKLTDLYK